MFLDERSACLILFIQSDVKWIPAFVVRYFRFFKQQRHAFWIIGLTSRIKSTPSLLVNQAALSQQQLDTIGLTVRCSIHERSRPVVVSHVHLAQQEPHTLDVTADRRLLQCKAILRLLAPHLQRSEELNNLLVSFLGGVHQPGISLRVALLLELRGELLYSGDVVILRCCDVVEEFFIIDNKLPFFDQLRAFTVSNLPRDLERSFTFFVH